MEATQSKVTLPEHRIFEQLWVEHSAGRIALQRRRVRVEQRAVQTVAPGDSQDRDPNYGSDSATCCAAIYRCRKSARFYLGLYDEFLELWRQPRSAVPRIGTILTAIWA